MDNKEFTLKGTIEKGVSKQGAEYEYLNLNIKTKLNIESYSEFILYLEKKYKLFNYIYIFKIRVYIQKIC